MGKLNRRSLFALALGMFAAKKAQPAVLRSITKAKIRAGTLTITSLEGVLVNGVTRAQICEGKITSIKDLWLNGTLAPNSRITFDAWIE
jgi:hypothetical protein